MESGVYMLSASSRGCGSSNPLSPSAQATLSKHLPKLSSKRLLQRKPQPQQQHTQCNTKQTSEVGCLTDVCSTENLPEVEIFSLLEEQIPKYKVRSDFLTDFSGYANQDWFVPAPALSIPSDGLGLTKEQTRETLNYFLLCGNRVSQMTRAYDDIEAVTRLLEEKEKDLELTVQIGKELLTQNNQLESRVSELESELKSANDDRSQLLHELHKKNELIAVLTNEDGSEAETPTLSKSITVDLLQKKITTLEDENKSLRMETTQLVNETDEIEAQERKLMEDLTCQLNDANGQFEGLSLELERQREENRLQHEQIVSLTARLSEAEMRLHQLTNDNDEHITLLNITKENQNSLALELVEFKQRYQEVLALLHEAQEQLRKHRKRIMPQARSTYLNSVGVSGAGSGLLQPDSLQSELMETSLYSENSLDSGIAGDYNSLHKRLMSMSQLSGAASTGGLLYGGGNAAVPPYKRVFETVRCATKVGNWSDGLSSGDDGPVVSLNSGPRMSVSTIPPGSYYGGGGGGGMGAKTYSYESLLSEQGEGYPSQPAGVPGAPGAKDLEIALKRLSPAEVLARRAMLTYAPLGSYNYDEQTQQAPGLLGVRTPDSIMSTGSSGISSHASAAHMSSSSQQHWRLPEKLQIVKPLEGSQTLHHWTRLATPTLSGLLDERPGVAIRGGRGLDELGMQLYTLSDVEEDIVTEDLPGKQFEGAGCTYTYTTSHVMHPAEDGFTNDLTFLSQSQISSRMASASTSRQPSCPPTPHAGMSRKNSCSTFSVNTGLASMLNERGIKAVTPSALNTPAGPNFTPTVTPCNSPEGSPTRSRSPEPYFGGILSTGADLIRRKLIGIDLNERRMMRSQDKLKQQQQKIMLSRLERRALRSLKLVEKVESIGLENIIAASHMSPDGSFSSTGSSGIISRSSSPMSNLRQLQANANNIVDDLHFDRQHIKGVLHKGLRESNNMNKSTHVADIRSDDSDTSDDGLIMHKIQKRKANSSSSITASPSTTATTDSSTKTAIDLKSKSNATTAANTNTVALPSATEGRLKSMQRQKSRRQLKNGLASAQRPDLGTINGAGGSGVRSDLGKVMAPSTSSTAAAETSRNTQHTDSAKEQQIQKMNIEQQASQSITQAFVGSISSLLFGRKGGWL